MSEEEKDLALQHLIGLSARNPDLVIIPGTVAWKKPFARLGGKRYQGGRAGIGIDAVDRVLARFDLCGALKPVSRAAEAQQSIQTAANRQGVALADPLSGPIGATNAPASQDKLNAMVGMNEDQTYMARNTAYVLYAGGLRLKYHKNGDFHEVLDGAQTIHIPGTYSGAAPVGNLVFGLEICLDHAIGILQPDGGPFGRPHLHVISSAAVQRISQHTVTRPGGYLLSPCCNDAWSGVWRHRPDGSFTRLASFRTVPIGGDPLRFYQIYLN